MPQTQPTGARSASSTAGYEPGVHDLVVDIARQKLARVMEVRPSLCTLRSPHGGLEWDAQRGGVRFATASDLLADRMRAEGLLTAQAVQ